MNQLVSVASVFSLSDVEPRYFEDGRMSPILRWVNGDLISLDQLVSISNIAVNGGEYGMHDERKTLTFSFHFMPKEIPFHQGLMDKCSIRYEYALDDYLAKDSTALPQGACRIRETSFGIAYYPMDPDGQYTSVNMVKRKIEKLVQLWEQYRLQVRCSTNAKAC